MKRTTFFKSLLLAAGLAVGANAWADNLNPVGVTKIHAGNADQVMYDSEATTWTCTQSKVSGGVFQNTHSNYGGSYIVIAKFDASSMLNGKNLTKATLKFDYVSVGNGAAPTAFLIGGGWTPETATWNNTNTSTIMAPAKTLKTFALTKTTTVTADVEFTDDLSADADKVFGIAINSDRGRDITISNIYVTIEAVDASSSAEYTLKYVDENNNTLKSVVKVGIKNDNPSVEDSEKANFFVSDVKYKYVSDDASNKTIEGDGSTVVTIVCKVCDKYNYTVTTSYGSETLPYTASGWTWEDELNVNISYPRYQLSGTQLVQKTPNNNNLTQNITVSSNGYSTDFAYSSVEGIDNVYLLAEAEDLGTTLANNSTSFTDRVSGRKIIYGASGTLLTLPAGKYIFTLGVIGGDNDNHKTSYVVKAGDITIAEGTCTGNFLTNITGSEFSIDRNTDITFTCSDPSSSRGIDLIYIQKTGDVELPANVTATLGKNGYTTFASAYDLDLSNLNGFKAYTATLSGAELSFTECTSKVVAGTGLLLKGTADAEVEIPVATADAAAVSGNALTGVTAPTAMKSDADGNYIFVMKKAASAADALTFLPLTTESEVTVPAGKAYVAVPASAFTGGGARALNVSFGNEATGINAVEATAQKEGAYNLNGQRVMQPTKGLYIVNGKKVIINK